MRARIETKAAKAGALRGRSGRKRRDRAENSRPGFDLRCELPKTGPYLRAKRRSQRDGRVFRVRKGSGASAGKDHRGIDESRENGRRKPLTAFSAIKRSYKAPLSGFEGVR